MAKKSVTLRKKTVGASTVAGGAVRRAFAPATPMMAESHSPSQTERQRV
ncbi:MAG: hypothetical protein LUD72_04385 [Bacteroidales bacterium]|nr:hypothetical protein [Bacteroidales bacterium]